MSSFQLGRRGGDKCRRKHEYGARGVQSVSDRNIRPQKRDYSNFVCTICVSGHSKSLGEYSFFDLTHKT